MPWHKPPKRPACGSNAARSAPFCCAKACAGDRPTVGVRLATKTLSQKNGGRQPLPPAPGWSVDGHRIKVPLDYGRGPEKTWVYGALRVRDGKELTRCAASRNSKGYI